MAASDKSAVRSESTYLTFSDDSWTITPSVNSVVRGGRRNDAILIGAVKVSEPSGVVSDSTSRSMLLSSNAYIRAPYHLSYDTFNSNSDSYTGEFSIQIYTKFHEGAFSSVGEYISNFSNASPSSGFEFFNNSSNNGFKFVTSTGLKTISSNTSLSSSEFTHIAVAFKDNTLKYYLNGALANTVTTSGALVSFQGRDLTFGGRNAGFTDEVHPVLAIENPPTTVRSFYIDEFALFNKHLSAEIIKNSYIETQIKEVQVLPFIYGNDASIQEVIDSVSLSDFGRMYIDEFGKAKYEHMNRFFETSIDQHASVQATLSDVSNIIDASYNVQLQTNKVIVKVHGVTNTLISKQGLWRAEDPTTLGVTSLTTSFSDIAVSMNVKSTDAPYFAKSGYIMIDDEIIKYSNTSSNSFTTTSTDRAQFDTTAASHNTDSLVREVKNYDILFDKSPAFKIENPLVTAVTLTNPALIDIIKFNPTPYGAKLILAASSNNSVGDIAYIEGTNPFTGEQHAASIAGIPVVITDKTGDVKEKKEALSDNIRKYGLKEITIDNEFITSLEHAQSLATFIIDKMGDPVPILNLNIMPMPKIQLGDRIRISSMDSFDIINGDYWVISTTFTYAQGVSQSVVLRKVI